LASRKSPSELAATGSLVERRPVLAASFDVRIAPGLRAIWTERAGPNRVQMADDPLGASPGTHQMCRFHVRLLVMV
jgi:hypothetical protein